MHFTGWPEKTYVVSTFAFSLPPVTTPSEEHSFVAISPSFLDVTRQLLTLVGASLWETWASAQQDDVKWQGQASKGAPGLPRLQADSTASWKGGEGQGYHFHHLGHLADFKAGKHPANQSDPRLPA